MTRRLVSLVARAVVLFVVGCCPAAAQTSNVHMPRFEISAGATWTGSSSFAPLAANEVTSDGTSLPLFSTQTTIDAVPGLQGRLGVRLSGRLHAEVAASYSKPSLTTVVSGDVENAAGGSASETLTQVVLEGNLLVDLAREDWANGRVTPFVSGGMGYLRQLHEGQAVVETGRTVQAGGGVKIALSTHADSSRRVGVRADVRMIARSGGVSPDGGTHVAPSFGASLFVAF